MTHQTSLNLCFKNLAHVGVFTRRLSKNHHVLAYISSKNISLNPHLKRTKNLDAVIGWGMKKQSLKAKQFGIDKKVPYFALEDGFIHSMSQGRLGARSWSIVADSTGIFYDASRPSDLELLISKTTLSTNQRDEAKRNIRTIINQSITKYNNTQYSLPKLLANIKKIILVIDQVEGDLSIGYSLATKDSFRVMLDAAIIENPNSEIFIKTHPDVLNAKKKGCIEINKELPPNVHVITENINPLLLIRKASKVYVVSSQTGLEALFLDKKVVCFGAPFYAGWGLTEDRLNNKLDVFNRRHRAADIETLFFAAYHLYSSYIHPDTLKPCSLGSILNYLVLQLKIQKKHKGALYCIGLTPWKKRFITRYLKNKENKIYFPKNAQDAEKMGFDTNSISCLWSYRHEHEALKLHSKYNTDIWRIEDGFIRSASLGSNYTLPCSLVVDKTGLYFDPSQSSDLEAILLETIFESKTLKEASLLRKQLISQAISKYNTGKRNIENFQAIDTHKKLILIPGQVSDDASIKKGCIDISTNLSLIKEVRTLNPDGFIIYKPHPDVLSGNRVGNIADELLSKYCDLIITDISITECLSQVDEVHTMTSLVGFEALVRGIKVYCYGIPFYSGWGLTIDRHSCLRRNRKLSIDQLTAGTLLLYPTYYNWSNQAFTTPSFIVNRIHLQLTKLHKNGRFISTVPSRWGILEKKLNLLKIIFNKHKKML